MDLESRIREKIIERRTEVHKQNEAEISARWSFEEAVSVHCYCVTPVLLNSHEIKGRSFVSR